MPDNTRLADALAGATVEMLREDAACLLRDAARLPVLVPEEERPMLYRLAALALAVSRLQEATDVVIEKAGGNVYVVTEMGEKAHATLPAALAALVS